MCTLKSHQPAPHDDAPAPTPPEEQYNKWLERRLGKKNKHTKPSEITITRAPGTCCPEPSCDYQWHDKRECKMCGKLCRDCGKLQHKTGEDFQRDYMR